MYIQQKQSQHARAHNGYAGFGSVAKPWNDHPKVKEFQRFVAEKDPSIGGDWFSAANLQKVMALWGPWLAANPIPAGGTPTAPKTPAGPVTTSTFRQMSQEEMDIAQSQKSASTLTDKLARLQPATPMPPPDNSTKYIVAAGVGLVLILGAMLLMRKK